MPRTRKDEAPVLVDAPVIEGRYVELDNYTVAFETFREDGDATPLFRGLPDDRCQCPHWGVVLSGRLVLRFADARRPTTRATPTTHRPQPGDARMYGLAGRRYKGTADRGRRRNARLLRPKQPHRFRTVAGGTR